jgi:S1-C subfamily serine protease
VPDLIQHGKVMRPSLGVQVANVQVSRLLGIDGALILELIADGGAARAGLQPTRRDERGRLVLGDLIIAVDGQQVRSFADLVLLLEQRDVGESVNVTVMRGGKRRDVKVVLQQG